MVRLSSATLASLRGRLALPDYDRRVASAGVVHIGVGGFHRGHRAMFHDRMMARGALEWGICGVGLLAGDQRTHDALTAQDRLDNPHRGRLFGPGRHQWVLEDILPSPRPPYESVGVQLTADVRPYEQMKLRLLNAGHQAVTYPGVLSGHRHVHESVSDPDLLRFLTDYLRLEGAPTVSGVDEAMSSPCAPLSGSWMSGSPCCRATRAFRRSSPGCR